MNTTTPFAAENTLFVDANGFIIPRPYREDYVSAAEFVVAVHEFNDAVIKCGNRAFDAGLR